MGEEEGRESVREARGIGRRRGREGDEKEEDTQQKNTTRTVFISPLTPQPHSSPLTHSLLLTTHLSLHTLHRPPLLLLPCSHFSLLNPHPSPFPPPPPSPLTPHPFTSSSVVSFVVKEPVPCWAVLTQEPLLVHNPQNTRKTG